MAQLLRVLALVLLISPSVGLAIGRRACLIGAGACLVPKAAHASYAMGVAAQQAQSWTPTSKEAERAVYQNIEKKLDEKRAYRDEAGTLGYVGGEYTQYRRGAARDEYEAKMAEQKKSSGSSGYVTAEELVMMQASRRAMAP